MRNYLFAGSHEAAQNEAMFYSLLGTCKLTGIEPFEWLKSLFEKLLDWKVDRLGELLPKEYLSNWLYVVGRMLTINHS